MKVRWRCALCALVLVVFSLPARADTLPLGHEVIWREIAIQGVEDFPEAALVLCPCGPPAPPDYCVVERATPFRGSGRLYALRRKFTKLKALELDAKSKTPWPHPIWEITTPRVGLECGPFFEGDPRVTKTGIDFGRSTLVVPTRLGLSGFREEYRLSKDADGKYQAVLLRRVWQCDSGAELVRGPDPDGGALDPPDCPPTPEPPTLPSGMPTLPPPRPGETLQPEGGDTPRGLVLGGVVVVIVLIGAGVVLGLRGR